MHPIRRLGCRAYQLAFRVALPVLPYRQPDLLGSLEEIPTCSARWRRSRPCSPPGAFALSCSSRTAACTTWG